MRVKCLAQEHNTMTRPGLEPGTFDPESSALITRPTRLPKKVINTNNSVKNVLLIDSYLLDYYTHFFKTSLMTATLAL